LTGIKNAGSGTDILENYNHFAQLTNKSKFEIEDFYFMKHGLPTTDLAPIDEARDRKRVNLREATSDQEVIHVTINKSSLKQLTKLSK